MLFNTGGSVLFKSLVVAFSTYSKLPMPRIDWDEKSMKYSMCCFPFVGLVIGCLLMLLNMLCEYMSFAPLVRGLIFTSIPILVTGGIHMDGFMDTVDAKSSYRSKEERLEILKDPHAGAFAIIYGCLYIIASIVLFSAMEQEKLIYIAMGYVYARILSGLSVVTLKKAKENGMLATTAKASEKSVRWILLIELLVCVVALMLLFLVTGTSKGFLYGITVVLAGVVSFLYYWWTAYRWFGGITGDLAGYFLQICELSFLIILLLV